jgi:hypothetical protein
MPDFRRGTAALVEAQEAAKAAREGRSFTPFAPYINWENDGEERYLLFLNQWEDMPQVDYIGFIPQTGEKGDGSSFTYYESVIARTDPGVGEDTDPMVQNWDAKPRRSHIAVAVELEPTFEMVERGGKTRKRPTGFEVKTRTFSRRVRDEKGELTDDREEVTAPEVGFVTQSPSNFFNVVASYDGNEAPIHETAVKITRVGGKGSNSTTYRIDGYPEQDIDLTNLLDNVEFISYLGDDRDEAVAKVEAIEDDLEAALAVGNLLLDKRLVELTDKERYDRIYATISASLDRFGGSKKNGGGESKAKPAARRSARRARPEADAPASGVSDNAVDAEDQADKPEASAAQEKIKRLREDARKRRAGKEEATV